MTPVAIALLRAIRIEQRPPARGERSAAARMVSAGLLEEFGKYLRGDGIRGRMLRLTPAGEVAWAKLPKPRSLMLPGYGSSSLAELQRFAEGSI